MSFWSNRKVLVTGGCGFIGSHIVDRLIQLGAVTTAADNLSKNTLHHLFEVWTARQMDFPRDLRRKSITAGPHRFVRCDFRSPSETREVISGHDMVIHLAANIGGRGYIDTHPADCCESFSLNHNVFSEAHRAGVERIAYSSSACVYPISKQASYDSDYLLQEDDAFHSGWANCDGEYGWAKFMGEMEAWAYHKQYGMKSSVVRYVTAYGPRENDTHAVIALIKRAVEKRDPYVVWGTGNQDRDFTYVDDIVSGTLLACEKITDGTPINLGTSTRYKIKDVARMILGLAGHDPKHVLFDASKPEGVATRALDITWARELLGWEPKVSLEEGLRKTIEWYREALPVSMETIA